MKKNKTCTSLNSAFIQPINERDDGQIINSCVATHSEKTRVE